MIRVTVTNTARSFEKSAESTTDESGNFFVKVVNLPYFMLEEDFDSIHKGLIHTIAI